MQIVLDRPVRYRREGTLAVATLDNPPVNALNHATRAGILAAIEAAETDPEVTALILEGSARAFSAGADIAEFSAPPQAPSLADLNTRLAACTKPTIALIAGVALGGGLELALACRHILASPQASLGLPEVKLGLIPGAGGTVRLPQRIGLVRALALIGDGEAVTATAAFYLGLLDAIVPAAADALEAARVMLANRPQQLIRESASDLAAFEAAANSFLTRHKGQAAPWLWSMPCAMPQPCPPKRLWSASASPSRSCAPVLNPQHSAISSLPSVSLPRSIGQRAPLTSRPSASSAPAPWAAASPWPSPMPASPSTSSTPTPRPWRAASMPSPPPMAAR
ncbi:enoyl-CoA hydratase/isomerase family protein [Devosia sp.]|uniref:enoyl-CoA hydratase/isomerase family protein n=1 Tax=Devosia sp. TaxID=1871048 RepID=UPI00345BA34F